MLATTQLPVGDCIEKTGGSPSPRGRHCPQCSHLEWSRPKHLDPTCVELVSVDGGAFRLLTQSNYTERATERCVATYVRDGWRSWSERCFPYAAAPPSARISGGEPDKNTAASESFSLSCIGVDELCGFFGGRPSAPCSGLAHCLVSATAADQHGTVMFC